MEVIAVRYSVDPNRAIAPRGMPLLLDAAIALLRMLIRPYRWKDGMKDGVNRIATVRADRRSIALYAHLAGAHDEDTEQPGARSHIHTGTRI
ncbi:hypothetical protein SAMN04490220_1479 [Rhodococcus jostii]|uniref:Uncharacterized protein n=1 Tax=Rhodococcus jostii TaxID=132919 RepID=A0A1H4S177_RHOJO|nr:hypothetical protein SAMN04490220_1479 [Rhodococcus jostii]